MSHCSSMSIPDRELSFTTLLNSVHRYIILMDHKALTFSVYEKLNIYRLRHLMQTTLGLIILVVNIRASRSIPNSSILTSRCRDNWQAYPIDIARAEVNMIQATKSLLGPVCHESQSKGYTRKAHAKSGGPNRHNSMIQSILTAQAYRD